MYIVLCTSNVLEGAMAVQFYSSTLIFKYNNGETFQLILQHGWLFISSFI